MALSFINTSGNIISEDFCQQLLSETKAEYVKSKSFGPDVKKVDEDIATTFELLREKWEEIRLKVMENQFDNSQLRDKWIKPFLSLLNFDMTFISHNLKNDAGIEYHIPYKGWNADDAPLIHMVHSSIDLDARDRNSRTHPNKSPHDLLQQFLNTSPHKWAILTNGKRIRVLRDFYHSITKGFIEFDIEGIFESANTEQFRILYRLLHSSRFLGQYESKKEEETICLLEKFHTQSRDTGVKVGDHLRKQVRIAIETLGNGFAENIDPDSLNEAEEKVFYSEILNIIYRLLFLLFAEQKGWLPVKNDVYARTYSINSLREKAEKGEYNFDNNEDLWEGLKLTFKLVTNGYSFPNGDNINAFGGLLFSDAHIYHIKSPLKNKHLLKAIDALCFFRDNNLSNKINYAALAIDELGSVYESLLDYEPRLLKEDITIDSKPYHRGEFILDDRSTERKTSGSYYTDSRLVAQLIDSALIPVIENSIKNKTTEEKRKAILDLKVADIACGSGAFLIAALEKIGEYQALIGKEEGEKPTEEELRQAKREVLQNCIYGVDLNPMAVELAKFSLWITASMPNLPLSFLDHKIKCGNSLIGATPELIKKGIPAEAYNPVTLDNSELCSQLKKRVKKELEGYEKQGRGVQTFLNFKVSALIETDEDTQQYLHILNSKQENILEVDSLIEEYEEVYQALRENIDWKLADAWTAAFFITKDDINKTYPTNLTLMEIATGNAIDEGLENEIAKLVKTYRFFHWHLEFPEVFEKDGFDCILGNPPWERVKLQEIEFFQNKSKAISDAKTKAIREKLINDLKINDLKLHLQYLIAKESSYKTAQFYINSGKYPILGKGDINTYMIFSESFLKIIKPLGFSGIIVPTNIVTDDTTKEFFAHIIENKNLVSLFDFENKKELFKNVHREQRFSLLTLSASPFDRKVKFAFFLHLPEQLNDTSRVFELKNEEIIKFNPNTKNCPTFKNRVDVEVALKIYKTATILEFENDNILVYKCKPWRMFDMTNDSVLFLESNDLDSKVMSLYEGKYTYIYDHRYATFKDSSQANILSGNPRNTSIEEHKNPLFDITPRHYISIDEYKEKIKDLKPTNFWLTFHGISNPNNERTLISTIIPSFPCGNSLPVFIFEEDTPNIEEISALLCANFNTFIFDFVCRLKMGSRNVNFFILKQLPLIPLQHSSDKIKEVII